LRAKKWGGGGGWRENKPPPPPPSLPFLTSPLKVTLMVGATYGMPPASSVSAGVRTPFQSGRATEQKRQAVSSLGIDDERERKRREEGEWGWIFLTQRTVGI